MLIDNKVIYIKVRKLNSAYAKTNSKRLDEVQINRTVGSSISSVNKMLANSEEQASIMGDIISISPNSAEWNKKLKEYWDSFSYDIPESGKQLEVGFVYDIDNLQKQRYITSINSNISVEKNKITTDKDLKDYIDNRIKAVHFSFNKTINSLKEIKDAVRRQKTQDEAYKIKYDSIELLESERFKVGRPINSFEYMLYRYSIIYGDVANEEVLVSKSPKIRFFLSSAEDIKIAKRAKSKADQNRIKLLVNVIDSIDSMENLLYAMKENDNMPTDDEDLYDFVEKLSVRRESEFISIASNPDLKLIGAIEKYISVGVLTRAEGSQVIFNPTNTESPIGNNMEEAIVYFKAQANKAIVSEFKTKYKNLAI
jgi:hypothetical protein